MLTRLTGSSLTHVSLRTIFFCKIKHEVDEVSVGGSPWQLGEGHGCSSVA